VGWIDGCRALERKEQFSRRWVVLAENNLLEGGKSKKLGTRRYTLSALGSFVLEG
jgi:hypothetical protein